MSWKNDAIFDFGFNMARVLVGGNIGVIDNVHKVVMIGENQICVDNGKGYTAVSGKNFVITEISQGRMMIEGEIQRIEFFNSL